MGGARRQADGIVAGVRALLVQALHPGALAGVADHSRYREDPFGRLAGTIRWIYTVSYGDTATARGGSDWVLRLHERVRGQYVDAHGITRPYAANDPDLARWVHLAFTDAFLRAAQRWGEPDPRRRGRLRARVGEAGRLMRVEDPPESEAELRAQMNGYLDRGELAGGLAAPVTSSGSSRTRRCPACSDPATGACSRERCRRSTRGTGRCSACVRRSSARSSCPSARTTELVLDGIGAVLGDQTGTERAALARIARLRARLTAARSPDHGRHRDHLTDGRPGASWHRASRPFVGASETRRHPGRVRGLESRDLVVGERRSTTAATASSMWCSFVAPTIGAVTAGLPATQARATCAIADAALGGDGLDRVDDRAVGVLVLR